MTLSRKPIRISVVDDEYLIATTLASVLRSQGFHATSFTEPLKALQAARCDPPDLIISEVSMSLLSGIELAIQVRKQCPDCKVLLLSGQPDISTLLEASRATGYTFEVLPKPIHPTHLLTRIHSLFGSMPRPEPPLISPSY